MTKAAPELVVFDVDGTLQDTFQWWPRVLRDGLARFATERGLQVEAPDDATACAVVGLCDADVWSPFLPPSHRHLWRDLRQTVVPLEVAELRAGRDYLYPGVRGLLAHLRRVGVKVALASNCRSRYFAAVCEGQGLASLSDWQYCLDSEGGATKADMVRSALAAANTDRAVMVGDRDTDREAALATGLAFVWRVNGRHPPSGPEPRWHGDPSELLHLLGLPGIS